MLELAIQGLIDNSDCFTMPEGNTHIWAAIFTRVLGDDFLVMDRIKVPKDHEYKSAYFRALCTAIFLMDSGHLARTRHAA
jgi:hypothetical protein